MATIGRIRHKDEVLAVLRGGRKIRTPYALIYVRPARESRMACVVGKKVHALAVGRHRLQRQLRESVRQAIPSLSASYDIVVVALPAAAKLESYTVLRQAVISAITQLQ